MNRLLFLAGLLPLGLAAETVDTAWVRRYDGPGHGSDWATCLQIDSSGNVYVAGPSTGVGTGGAYVVIKYRPNGDTAWVRRMDFGGGNDTPNGLGVDRDGNVYVTGQGGGRVATLKYDSTGLLLWQRTYGTAGGATDVALDAGGNVLLCGWLYRTTDDFITMKYRPNGDTAWTRVVDWANDIDVARALALSGPQNVGVTGDCWSSTDGDYLTVAYDSAGSEPWRATYDGPAVYDIPADLAVDSAGSIIVTGRSQGLTSPTDYWDYLTIKYSPEGETMWTRRYNGPANDWDEARAVAVDGEGSVYVTGYSSGSGSNYYDWVTVKYDPDGAELWVARYDGPASGIDHAYALVVDQQGNAYVTGGTRLTQSVSGCHTIKYGPDGETLWTATYRGEPYTATYGSAIGVDGRTCVCVAGEGAGDIIVIKYVQSGGIAEATAAAGPPPGLTAEPSPCRDHAVVSYSLLSEAPARLTVRDISGRRVRLLAAGRQPARKQSIVWDLRDAAGRRVPAGVYVVELLAGAGRDRVKIEVLD